MFPDQDLESQCQQRVGQTLRGKWLLTSLIGVGGMAAVYAARHRNGAVAAIKVLHPVYAQLPDIRQRFQREAYIANKVEHPGTVRVLDDDVTEDGTPYLVMDLLRGMTVDRYVQRRGGRLSIRSALAVVDHTLEVLAAAHDVGVIHRDLKPDNLFLTEDRSIRVLDFGIARLHEDHATNKTRTGLVMGTPGYMAPEQALGKLGSIDERTDVWSMGAILYYLVTGREVHESDNPNEQVLHTASRPVPSLARLLDGPPELVRIADSALEFERDKRFGSAREMRSEVRKLRDQLGGIRSRRDSHPGDSTPVHAAPMSLAPATPVPSSGTHQQGRFERSSTPPAGGPQPAGGMHPALRETRPAMRSQQPPVAFEPAPPSQRMAAAPRMTPSGRFRLGGSGQYWMPSARAASPRSDSEARALFDRDTDSVAERLGLGRIEALFDRFDELLRALHDPTTAARPASDAVQALATAVHALLTEAGDALVFRVQPHAFTIADRPVWQPAAPLHHVPHRLVADGVRRVAILAGVGRGELQQLAQMLVEAVRAPGAGVDLVELLWSSPLPHIAVDAEPLAVEEPPARRDERDKLRASLRRLFSFDTSVQLEDAWRARARATSRDDSLVASWRAVVEGLAERSAEPQPDEMLPVRRDAARDALRVELATLQGLANRLRFEDDSVAERLLSLVGRLRALGGAKQTIEGRDLQAQIEALATREPRAVLPALATLARAAGAEGARLLRALVSDATLSAVLRAAAAQEGFRAELDALLDALGPEATGWVEATLGDSRSSDISALLSKRVDASARGPARLAAQLRTARLGDAIELLRQMGELGPDARRVLAPALENPDPLVRVAAWQRLGTPDSVGLRRELTTLLVDASVGGRIDALRALRAHDLKHASAFVAERVKIQRFRSLPANEQQELITTLAALDPDACESVLVELLSNSPDQLPEAVRNHAVDLLARYGGTRADVWLRRWAEAAASSASFKRAVTDAMRWRATGSEGGRP